MMEHLAWDRTGWESFCADAGLPKYRAAQMMTHLMRGDEAQDMLTLPAALRAEIAGRFEPMYPALYDVRRSVKDGTEKPLYRMTDGQLLECVYMRNDYGNTLCLSTQAGCAMGCAFCASTLDGLARDLSAGEMMGQVIMENRRHARGGIRGVDNIVLMGSGEPLANYDNIVTFLQRVTAKDGLFIGARNISLSTCGLCDGIRRLAGEGLPITLCVSLHAAQDETRTRIMPIARRYPMDELMEACRYWIEKTGRRVIFEYALMEGINDGGADALRLAALVRGMNCHINLIALNPVPERGMKPPPRAKIIAFLDTLMRNRVSATVRRSLGADIEGACGQLRRRAMKGEDGT